MPRANLRNWRRLTPEERQALVRRARDGEADARDRLVRLCRPTVRSMANLYEGRGLPIEDLEGEGMIGLLLAIPAYDPVDGMDFRTFASQRIRSEILQRLVDETRLVRLPQYLAESVPRVRRAIDALRDALGRAPTVGEVTRTVRAAQAEREAAGLAHRLGHVPSKEEALRLKRRRRIPCRVVERVMDYLASFPPKRPVRSIGSEETLPPDAREDDPGAALDAEERRRTISLALGRLPPNEQRVLRLRWRIAEGVAGDPWVEAANERKRTQREVGMVMQISREEVQQFEQDGLRRLEEILLPRAGEL